MLNIKEAICNRLQTSRSQLVVHHQWLKVLLCLALPSTTSGSESVTPITGIQQGEEIVVQDSSDSSPEEGSRNARINWSEEDNLRLASAWVMHSVDSVKGK